MPYKDKARHNENQRRVMQKLRQSRRIWLDSLKADKPCKRCQQIFPPIVMDWHHRDASQKVFGISRAIHISSEQKILDEISKCDLYCANCHRIVEQELA